VGITRRTLFYHCNFGYTQFLGTQKRFVTQSPFSLSQKLYDSTGCGGTSCKEIMLPPGTKIKERIEGKIMQHLHKAIGFNHHHSGFLYLPIIHGVWQYRSHPKIQTLMVNQPKHVYIYIFEVNMHDKPNTLRCAWHQTIYIALSVYITTKLDPRSCQQGFQLVYELPAREGSRVPAPLLRPIYWAPVYVLLRGILA
jgi:hypothetical protein